MICALLFVAGLMVGGGLGVLAAGLAMAAKGDPPAMD